MTNFFDLNEDVAIEIMSWLPVESLQRFKLVCKNWYYSIHSLMNNSFFVLKHYANMDTKLWSSKEIYLRNISALSPYGPITSYIFTILANNDHDHHDDGCIPNFHPFTHYYGVSYYNGIICINTIYSIALCNLALKKLKFVPLYRDEFINVKVLGFGYDSRANDYKIIAIKGFDSLEIYSLNSNSWKLIQDSRIDQVLPQFGFQVVNLKKFCYCYCWCKKLCGLLIISTQIENEEIEIIRVPENHDNWLKHCEDRDIGEWTRIVTWNEEIALFFFAKSNPTIIDMWVLMRKRNGDHNYYCWTKFITLGPFEGIRRPLTLWKDQVLYMSSEDDIIFVYKFGINSSYCCTHFRGGQYFVPYVKSLTSVIKRA
ncbi:jacalin-related lectin 38-like [Cannabis sativa]|uniref:jacalin-related lectin 38-like n=1 Tax=Cannabis sativa TaxID=3483 RepID=UPI0029C9CDD1|nr:jacalin-related lectin 38-like [Cannabis sativa]